MNGKPIIETDLRLGGRIKALRSLDGFEWLWTNPRAQRDSVEPGDPFVDAGGVEECFPTVVGNPDHGDVWSRQWNAVDEATAWCETSEARFIRSVVPTDSAVDLNYRVEAEPGYRFVWAFHALINPAPQLHLHVDAGALVLHWPEGYGRDPVRSRWPQVGESRQFDEMAIDDGTAVFALLPDRNALQVEIGERTLVLKLDAPGCPASFGLWRNLKGYSWDGGTPYRSVGIEPMIGRNPNRQSEGEAAMVPSSGFVEWNLHVVMA